MNKYFYLFYIKKFIYIYFNNKQDYKWYIIIIIIISK